MDKNLDLKFSFYFQFLHSRGIGLSEVVRLGMGVNSLALEKPTYQILAYYSAWKKFLVGLGGPDQF